MLRYTPHLIKLAFTLVLLLMLFLLSQTNSTWVATAQTVAPTPTPPAESRERPERYTGRITFTIPFTGGSGNFGTATVDIPNGVLPSAGYYDITFYGFDPAGVPPGELCIAFRAPGDNRMCVRVTESKVEPASLVLLKQPGMKICFLVASPTLEQATPKTIDYWNGSKWIPLNMSAAELAGGLTQLCANYPPS